MDTIKKAVLTCVRHCGPDHDLEAALSGIISREGDPACKVVLEVLTHLEFEAAAAVGHWQQIVAHQASLSEALQRPVPLAVAVCDYFQCVEKHINFPKLVDVCRFEEICHRNQHDSLTGLHNREAFDEALAHEVAKAKRQGRMLSLLFMDIDSFKEVNDTHGHLVGDLVLQTVGDILLSTKRAADLAARYGGDEFLLLLPDTNKKEALVLKERIRSTVAGRLLDSEVHPFRIQISGGVATFPDDAGDDMGLKKFADDDLYRIKRSARTCFKRAPLSTGPDCRQTGRSLSCPGSLCPAIPS